MKQEVLSRIDDPTLPIIGLIIFFIIFLLMTVWAYHKDQKNLFQIQQNLPFDEGKKHE